MIEPLTSLPDSLRQHPYAPTQADRLPAEASLPIELRAVTTNPATRRMLAWRLARWLLMWFCLLAATKLFSTYYEGWGGFFFTVLFGVLLAWYSWNFLLERTVAYRVLHVATILLFLFPLPLFPEPYYAFGISLVALLIFADRLATHFFYAATNAVESPRERQRQRLRWSNRFNILDHSSRTVPLYPFVLASPLLAFCQILKWHMGPVVVVVAEDLLMLLCAIPTLIATALCIEPLLAFVTGRRPLWPWRLMACTRAALVDWFNYNPADRVLPGVLASPSGEIAQRRSMGIAAIALTALPIVWLSFYPRVPVTSFYQALWATPTKSERGYQPYQLALLESLPEEEREEYRRELMKQPPEPYMNFFQSLPMLLTEPGLFEYLSERHEYNSVRLWTMATVYFGAFWARLLMVLPSFLLVPFYFWLILVPAIGRAASVCGDRFKLPLPTPEPTVELWQDTVEKLQQAGADEVYLGLNSFDRTPVVLPASILREHAHVLGDSGSGKTSMGLAPLVSQLLRRGDASVLLLDLKGDDPAFFENCRIESAAGGVPFRWFTNELGKSTYVFNPLRQRFLAGLTRYQQTDLLTAALGMQYGTDYGRGYFSDANAEVLFHALDARDTVGSFAELATLVRDPATLAGVSHELRRAGSHLSAILTRIGSTAALNAGSGLSEAQAAAAIDMQQLFESPHALYFYLPSSISAASSAEIARMAMYSLLAAAKSVPAERRNQVYLVVDEFQRIVSNNLELFLQTARSMNIGVVLANQSMSDLRKPGADLVAAVCTNTRVRQVFAAGHVEDLKDLVYTAGESVFSQQSTTYNASALFPYNMGELFSRSFSETVRPRLGINDLLLASDHPQHSVVHVRRGDGVAQYGGFPFVAASSYHISADEHERRKRASWPSSRPETILPTSPAAGAVTDDLDDDPTPTVDPSPDAVRLMKSLDDHYESQQPDSTA